MIDNPPRPTSESATTTRLEEHHLSRLSSARTRTLVMQRKRRILVASRTSDPPEPGTTSLSYSIISIEEVSLSTTQLEVVNSFHDKRDQEPQVYHRYCECPTLGNTSELNSATARGRYINTLQQRHYLRNGLARRSRYDSSSDVSAHEPIHSSSSTSSPLPFPITIPPRPMSPREQTSCLHNQSYSHSALDDRPLFSSFSLPPLSSLGGQTSFRSPLDKIPS
ncbi:hypothetical protein E1B28_005357 [Marasmius oreades]|uniref:Uncharacterized protein n=1 Tax=Marasmius oreades TaxID=181124 RepID=A0A9P7S4W5_9AGAR|nr:uncharacterized protein E1B28_005357 [Marasmius oreades]KAG7094528.1 hypothetical protein E1B28_005357 [Marasmius oreades]